MKYLIIVSLLFLGFGCNDTKEEAPPLDASACIATFGDHCGCEPQCMTSAELEATLEADTCDLECDSGAALAWTCEIVDGRCAVAP